MKAEIKKEIITCCTERERVKCERVIDTELTLPDYCGDIKRILKCTLTPGVHSVSVSGDRAEIKGTAVIRIIYADEKEQLDCCEKTVEIALSGQLKPEEGKRLITATAAADYVNCRALSQRKVSISGSVSVLLSSLCESKKEVPSLLPSCIQVKKEKITREQFVCHTEKTFDMSETVALDKGKASIGKILERQAFVDIETLKAVQDKLLVKGELTVKTVYLPPEGHNKPETVVHTMPLSQIVDLEGVDEGCSLKADCRISELLLGVKSDSSQAGRLLEIAAKISCYVSAVRVKDEEYISDCYCTRKSYTPVFSSDEVLTPVYSVKKPMKLTESIDASSVGEICDVWISDCKTEMSGAGDKAEGRITLTACMLYLDSNGVPAYKEKELAFSSDIALKDKYSLLRCDFSAAVSDVKAELHKEGTAEISIDIIADIRICALNTRQLLSSIEENEIKNEAETSPALTLYFPSRGEKIWDIAKKYGSTADGICRENGIDGDSVKGEGMLLIPCV